MSDYISYIVHVRDQELKDRLVAELSMHGAEGFEEEKNVLKVYAPGTADEQAQLEKIILAQGLMYSKAVVAERNWNAEWEAGFQPVRIGSFCNIRASFHEPDPDVEHDIIINPQMSFGTGHHATTSMMVAAMQTIALDGARVFDFGTGTGILAILASKCGAAKVTAIDNEEWSIRNATDNFVANGCTNILISRAEEFLADEKYDVILANINRNFILAALENIQQHLVKNGVVLLSGMLTGDMPALTAALEGSGLMVQGKTEMDGWICVLAVNC